MLDADPTQLRRKLVGGNIVVAGDIAKVVAVHAGHWDLSHLFSAYERLCDASSVARQAIFADPRTSLSLEKCANFLVSPNSLSSEEGCVDQIVRDFTVFALSSALLDGTPWRIGGRVGLQGSYVLPGTTYKVQLPTE